MLATARADALCERHEGSAGRLGATVQVRLGRAHPHGRGIRVAGDVQRPGGGGDNEVGGEVVGLGTVLAKRSDGDVDECGIDLGKVDGAETARGHRSGVGGLDEDVGGGDKASQLALPLGGFEVELDAAAVAGVGGPVERLLAHGSAVEEGRNAAGGGAAGRLDQDHVGAQPGEDVAAEQAALVREVEDTIGA